MKFQSAFLALGASIAWATPGMAADVVPLEPAAFEEMHTGKPAVSALNGKLELGYAWYQYDLFDGVPESEVNADNIYGIGTISLPVGEQFGLQLDAGIMHGFEDDLGPGGILQVKHSAYGIAGHLFWRDPDTALLGIYGSYERINRDTSYMGFINFPRETDVVRIAAAGEYYLDNFTVEGHVGADFLDTTLNVFGTDISDSGTYLNARAVAAYYPTDNARIFAGARYAFEQLSGVGGAEVMFASNHAVAPAVFLEGSISDDSASVFAGLRVYFGGEGKSLKRRHREDDPASQLFKDIPALSNCVALPEDFMGEIGPQDEIQSADHDSYVVTNSCGLSYDFGEVEGPYLPVANSL